MAPGFGGPRERQGDVSQGGPARQHRPRRSHSMREFSTGPAAAAAAAAAAASKVPATGRRCAVTLPDDRRLDVNIPLRMLTSELADIVASHCQLKERKYFGLAYRTDTGENQWLHPDVRVLEHDLPRTGAPLPLHFLVRYYPESFTMLRDAVAVELFYQQARSGVFKCELETDGDTIFKLAALALQASHGDYVDDATTRQLLKRTALLPASVVTQHPSVGMCEERVIEEYRSLTGTARGTAIVSYLSQAERLATYGIHFYRVTDRGGSSCWWLGISTRGIAQYDINDRSKAKRLFQWKQLENVTFRDGRFSIEVDEPKKVVHALSSFNVYEDAIGNDTSGDDLVSAISDPNTQVSVSRRTLGPGHISVYSWLATSQTACRNIWFTAVSQHQFHVEVKKESRAVLPSCRPLSEIARELSRSSAALSVTSSGSLQSLTVSSLTDDSDAHAARMQMSAALQARRDALQAKLRERTDELRLLCLKEAELTGQLPPELPLAPGEEPPQIRRRMGTAFSLPETLINRLRGSQEELVSALELDYEIQSRITTAALKLANDATMKKVRKQRKLSYQLSAQKLREIETKLKAARARQEQRRRRRQRAGSDGEDHHSEEEEEAGSLASAEGVSLSPAAGVGTLPPRAPRSPVRTDGRHSHAPDTDGVDVPDGSLTRSRAQSAPGSPKKLPKSRSAGCQLGDSREPSPGGAEVNGGYFPSSVYTRSSYRSKQYPTLCQRETPPPPPPREYWSPGGLYSVPQRRTAPPSSHAPPAPPPPTAPTQQSSPMHHLSVDELDGSFDAAPPEDGARFGSLDRRRHVSSSGHATLEARSMDRLDSAPVPLKATHQRHGDPPAARLSPLQRPGEGAAASGGGGGGPRWPPPPQPPRFTDSPLSGASDASLQRVVHARTVSLPVEPAPAFARHPSQTNGFSEATARRRREKAWYETSLDSPEIARRTPRPTEASSAHREPRAPDTLSYRESRHPDAYRDARPADGGGFRESTSGYREARVPDTPSSGSSDVSTGPYRPAPRERESREAARAPVEPRPVPAALDVSITPLVAPPRREVPVTPLEALATPRQSCRPGGAPRSASPQSLPPPSLQHATSQQSPLTNGSAPPPPGGVPVESPHNQTVIKPGTFQPYRETSKPFEMSDFYKYSTKFRRQSQGSSGAGDSPGGSSVPPSPLSPGPPPARGASPVAASPQRGLYQPPAAQSCLPARPAPAPAQTSRHRAPASGDSPGQHNASFHLPSDSVAETFQQEMLAWYSAGRGADAAPSHGPGAAAAGAATANSRSATLV